VPEIAILATKYIVHLHHPPGRANQPSRASDRHALLQPVPVMALVEVVRGLATSDATFDQVHALAIKLGRRR